MNNDHNQSDSQQQDPADQAGQLPAGQQSARRQPASLLRRAAPAAVLGGVAVALVGFLDSGLTSGPTAASESTATAATASSTPTTEANSTTEEDSGSGPTTDAQAAAPSATATTEAESCAGTTETVTGSAVAIPWGDVQVAATIANGKVCEVHAVAYPAGDPHSARINSMAIPTIDSAATSAGVAFDNISGATYTSEAYRKSLQSILDQL